PPAPHGLVPPAHEPRLGLAAEQPGRPHLRPRRGDALLPPPLAPGHRSQLAEPPLARHRLVRRRASGRPPLAAPVAPPRARSAHGRLRAHPVPGSVVHPAAAAPRRDDYRRMVYAEHLPDELPVAFEAATVGDAMSRGVISCRPETPLRVVARMMATYGVHAIFVFEHTDEEDEAPRLWAVVSDLDLV